MARDHQGNRLRAERAVAGVEMNVPSVGYRWVRQGQAPARQITKTSRIASQLDRTVDNFDVHRSALHRCDDSYISAVARNRQRDLIHGDSMARRRRHRTKIRDLHAPLTTSLEM